MLWNRSSEMTLLELCCFWDNVTKRCYVCVCVCVCVCVRARTHFRNILLQTHRWFPNILEHYPPKWFIFYKNNHTKAFTISVYGPYLFTYLLTPCSTVLLGKLTGSQLVKKFTAFYGTRMFITAFTRARHLSLSWTSSIQSTPEDPS